MAATNWSTALVNDLPDSAFLYVEKGGSVVAGKTTPRSLRHFPYRDADGEVDLPHLLKALDRIPNSNLPGLDKVSLKARAQQFMPKEPEDEDDEEDEEDDEDEEEEDDEEEVGAMAKKGFTVIKADDGTYRWIAISSSAFVDREGEIVSTKALSDDVVRADKTGERGPLILWHQPGTEIGDCDFQAVEGRLLIESGTFRQTDFARTVRKALQRYPEPLGVSIGFRHTLDQPDADGVFHSISIHERSVCPHEVAANPWTSFETLKEASTVDEPRKKWFQSLVGSERAEKILTSATTRSAELENLFAFKAMAEPPDAPAPPDPEPDPAPDDPDELTQKAGEFFEAIAETVNESLAPAVEAIKAQDNLIERMYSTIKELDTRLAAVEESQKSLSTVNDPTPAERARAALRQRPTEREDNVIDSKTVEDLLLASGTKTRAPDQPTNPVTAYVNDILKGSAE